VKISDGRPRPLYWRVADDIASKIDTGDWAPGQKLPSEHDLCARYRVSQITVRRALRELAHLGRVYSHHGVGWFVRKTAASTDLSDKVILALPELNWINSILVHRLVEELGAAGISLQLVFTRRGAEGEARALGEDSARGASAILVIVDDEEEQQTEHYARLAEEMDSTVLFLLREPPGLEVPAVVLDEQACVERTTRHLLSLGHRRLAYVGDDPQSIGGSQRYWGFASTIWEHGLELPLDWVFASRLTTEAGAESFKHVFGPSHRPTAIVCGSDGQAAHAMQLLLDLGVQCPEEVAVVGLGDRDFAPLLSPPLTTVAFDLEGLGRMAATMVLDLLDGHLVSSSRVSGSLVVRQSCGAGSARGF